MNETQTALLRRVLSSKYFANAESLKRILTYICERTSDSAAPPLKERDLAIEVLRRPADFTPKTDPSVRVNLANIRERLTTYFENEGREEPLRLIIPRAQYRAVFMEADAAFRTRTAETTNWFLEKFWRPHLTDRVETILVFNDLLCFTDDQGNFVRNMRINQLDGVQNALKSSFPGLPVDLFRPAYPYVSAGEVRCMVRLLSFFSTMGVRVQARSNRRCYWNTLRDSHLILLGSARTNTYLDSLQGANPIVIEADCLRNTEPRPGEEPVYRGFKRLNGNIGRFTEYALVTRSPSLRPGRIATVIAANHERAVEGAGEYLTDDNNIRQMVSFMGLETQEQLPSHFQVILRIEMIDIDEEVIQVEPVLHRIGQA